MKTMAMLNITATSSSTRPVLGSLRSTEFSWEKKKNQMNRNMKKKNLMKSIPGLVGLFRVTCGVFGEWRETARKFPGDPSHVYRLLPRDGGWLTGEDLPGLHLHTQS